MKTIFEKSNGVDGIGFEEIELGDFLPQELIRKDVIGLPQLSELEVMRHYKELSDRNFCIEKGFYPLGSCTMKYNPKVNELLASLEGFANLHPLQSDEDSQGALELMYNLQEALKKITGMDAATLQPAADEEQPCEDFPHQAPAHHSGKARTGTHRRRPREYGGHT